MNLRKSAEVLQMKKVSKNERFLKREKQGLKFAVCVSKNQFK